MPSSITRVETPSGKKYMTQLCKHWGHKLNVTLEEERGRIEFDPARACDLRSDPEGLSLRVITGTDEELERTQQTVINHLKRFAFREEFGDVTWTREG